MSVPHPQAVVLRHVAFEHLGLLGPLLNEAGWAISSIEAPTADLSDPAIDQADLLIVLGGPIGVYETEAFPFLTQEIRILERRLASDRPTLGICLGSQLMAKALGARVFAGPTKEIGWGAIELTDDGKRSCLKPLSNPDAKVLHWHGDTFDLPNGATRLARNNHYENQAFAYGRHAMGLQFHLEADPGCLDAWYVGHTVELSTAGVSIPGLRAQTNGLTKLVQQQARLIFNDWLDEIARR